MKRIVCMVMAVIVATIVAGCERKLLDTYDLIAMELGSEISGSVFLASGRVGEKEYFYAYVRDSDGDIKRIRKPTTWAVLRETDGAPRVEVWREVNFGHTFPVFYVPRGSIVPSYLEMIEGGQK